MMIFKKSQKYMTKLIMISKKILTLLKRSQKKNMEILTIILFEKVLSKVQENESLSESLGEKSVSTIVEEDETSTEKFWARCKGKSLWMKSVSPSDEEDETSTEKVLTIRPLCWLLPASQHKLMSSDKFLSNIQKKNSWRVSSCSNCNIGFWEQLNIRHG